MSDEALAALAAVGASVLVKLIATDDWEAVKARFVRVLSRGDVARADRAQSRLDQTRSDLLAAAGPEQEQIAVRLEAAWQARLTDLLDEDPEAEGELQMLVNEAEGLVGQPLPTTTQYMGRFGRAQQAIQGHGVQVNTFVGQDEPSQHD